MRPEQANAIQHAALALELAAVAVHGLTVRALKQSRPPGYNEFEPDPYGKANHDRPERQH
jgi:hypothetical protein